MTGTARPQINIRLTSKDKDTLEALIDRIRQATGVPVRLVDVYRMAIRELEKQYPASKKGGK